MITTRRSPVPRHFEFALPDTASGESTLLYSIFSFNPEPPSLLFAASDLSAGSCARQLVGELGARRQ
jgi:hypothetical protein